MLTKITSGAAQRQRKKTQPQTIVPSQQAQLVAELEKLGDPVVAAEQANCIIAAMRALQLRSAGGYDIGKDADNGFYARLRQAEVRHDRELPKLATVARRAIAGQADIEEWIEAWAALPARTSARLGVRQFIRKEGSRSTDPRKVYGYSSPKITMIIPRPEYALPAIEAAIEQMKKKQPRQADKDEAAVIRAVISAYEALTGKRSGRVISDGQDIGPLHQLGLAVDRIFGTKIFPQKDSRRIQKILGTRKHKISEP